MRSSVGASGSARTAGLTAALLLAAACGVPGSGLPGADGTPATTHEVLPGVGVEVVEPATGPPAAVVVLVPGGGWTSADPAGMVPLAEHLATSGALVVLGTYRTAGDGAFFPRPVQDVGCVAAFAADLAADLATEGGAEGAELVLLGHSAGAQLAAVVALDPGVAADPACPYPPAAADRLVGLAGPYDVVAAADQAWYLFGPDTPDPDDWDAGDPVALAGRRPELPVLLVHGSADTVVPLTATYTFWQALRAGGHTVDIAYPDGADHHTVYSADVAAPVVEEWLGLGVGARG
ncbi:alpha/beta hydrolase family protein [Aquipuribacter nitratireducens]|uniref:Alpha/beta hydrolase family protein n=1 Tax=Aquipuribacter nitratireducens TaxID=650104 RepID=A0ABW0GRZ3_9MICO